jgi:hypothetical protein
VTTQEIADLIEAMGNITDEELEEALCLVLERFAARQKCTDNKAGEK